MIRSIYILFCLLPMIIFGQDTLHSVKKKTQFTFQIGVSYKTFLSKKYIEPTPYNFGDEFKDHQYDRFTKVSTNGFSVGFLFTRNMNDRWSFETGLIYFLKKDIFENNRDTVIKYGNGFSMRDIHNVIKYDYSNNNMELPIVFRYTQKKLNFYCGAYIQLLTYKKVIYTYIINQYSNWSVSEKTVEGFEMPLIIFPTLQVSYDSRIKNIALNPFAGFYYGITNQRSFYIQLGINFPLEKSH